MCAELGAEVRAISPAAASPLSAPRSSFLVVPAAAGVTSDPACWAPHPTSSARRPRLHTRVALPPPAAQLLARPCRPRPPLSAPPAAGATSSSAAAAPPHGGEHRPAAFSMRSNRPALAILASSAHAARSLHLRSPVIWPTVLLPGYRGLPPFKP